MRNNNTVGGILWNWILVISYNGLSHSLVWMWRYNDLFVLFGSTEHSSHEPDIILPVSLSASSPSSFLILSHSLFLPIDIVYVLMLIMTVVMTASLALTCTQPLQLSWWFTASSSPHREREWEAHYSCLWGELYVHCKLATEAPPQRPSHRADHE